MIRRFIVLTTLLTAASVSSVGEAQVSVKDYEKAALERVKREQAAAAAARQREQADAAAARQREQAAAAAARQHEAEVRARQRQVEIENRRRAAEEAERQRTASLLQEECLSAVQIDDFAAVESTCLSAARAGSRSAAFHYVQRVMEDPSFRVEQINSIVETLKRSLEPRDATEIPYGTMRRSGKMGLDNELLLADILFEYRNSIVDREKIVRSLLSKNSINEYLKNEFSYDQMIIAIAYNLYVNSEISSNALRYYPKNRRSDFALTYNTLSETPYTPMSYSDSGSGIRILSRRDLNSFNGEIFVILYYDPNSQFKLTCRMINPDYEINNAICNHLEKNIDPAKNERGDDVPSPAGIVFRSFCQPTNYPFPDRDGRTICQLQFMEMKQ